MRGRKRTSGRSSNSGDNNIITQGSIIAVADGQAMIIVEQGKIVEFCNEPGEYTFDASTEPTIFNGGLNKETLMSTFNSKNAPMKNGALCKRISSCRLKQWN